MESPNGKTLVPLTEYPQRGDTVWEYNMGLVEYIVDDQYLRVEYPEIITLEVVRDYGDGYFNPGHMSVRNLEDLLTEE